jgi:hypothetical protein
VVEALAGLGALPYIPGVPTSLVHLSYSPLPPLDSHHTTQRNHPEPSSDLFRSHCKPFSIAFRLYFPAATHKYLAHTHMSSPSMPMSREPPSKAESGAGYRTVEYRNGSVVCVQESRRRRHREAKSDASRYLRTRHLDLFDMRHDSTSSVIVEEVHSLIEAKGKKDPSSGLWHVTSAVPMRPRAKKPMITQETANKDAHATLEPRPRVMHMLTPPSTPKIERLPTPELPELEESAFCECCEAASHVVRYCASCEVEFGDY